jgi:uncharacterized lipoprotein YajG
MNTSFRWFVAGLAAITLGSCAYQSQIIRLHPVTPQLSPAPADSAGEVVLVTRDARASQVIGKRVSGSSQEAVITTDTDIAALLQTQMTEILKAKGYRVLPSGPSSIPTLDVQLKELTYTAFTAANERKVKVQVVLETIVKNELKTFRDTYKADQERRVVIEPVAKSNEEWINEAFAIALKELTNDSKLYTHLE